MTNPTPNKDPMVEKIVEEFDNEWRQLNREKKTFPGSRKLYFKEWLRTTLLRFKEEVEGEIERKLQNEFIGREKSGMFSRTWLAGFATAIEDLKIILLSK